MTESWWAGATRENFSAVCCERFACNFDNAPTFIIRSEFIKTKGSNTHFLHKQIAHGLEPLSAGRKVARTKYQGERLSEKAMQSASLL